MPTPQQAQPDPWAAAAAAYKGSGAATSAAAPSPSGGNDDWKMWQAQDEQPQPLMSQVEQGAKDFGKGVLKGGMSTVSNLDDIARKHLPAFMTNQWFGMGKPTDIAKEHQMAETHNTAQDVGKDAEQVGEFFIPGGAEEGTAAHLGELAPKIKPLLRIGTSAVGAGAVNKAQGGGFGAGAAGGAVGGVIGEGLRTIAPHLAESALNIRKTDRGYGKGGGAIGRAALDETSGFTPGAVAESAQSRLSELNPQLNEAADRASVRPNSPRGLLPGPASEIPLHSSPDIAGIPSRPVTLYQPGRGMARGLPAPSEGLPMSSHSDIFKGQLPSATSSVRAPFEDGEAHGMGPGEYIGQIPGERGGVGTPQGVLIRPFEGGSTPIPSSLPSRGASLGPAKRVLMSAFDTAQRQGERTTANQLQPMAAHLTEDLGGSEIPNDITPRQLLDLKRGFGNEFIHRWNPETMNGVKGTAAQTYHAMGDEFNRVVPGAQDLNGRISTLIPVAKRAESAELNAPTVQRMAHRVGAHTGAMATGLVGGYQGYERGGIPGAVAGAVLGTAIPEALASPTGEMAAARLFNRSAPLTRAATGTALQLNRKNKNTDDN